LITTRWKKLALAPSASSLYTLWMSSVTQRVVIFTYLTSTLLASWLLRPAR